MLRLSLINTKVDRLLGMTAAAVAATSCAGLTSDIPQASADIVYSGVVNLNIPYTTNGLYLNVVTGAINEPGNTGGGSVPGWDLNPWGSGSLSFFNPAAPAGGVYVQRTGGGATANLPAGTLIDAGSLYGAGAGSQTGNEAFIAPGDNLVGFRFLNEANSQVHYGWMRINLQGNTLGNTGARTVVDYAYESSPGVGIGAGAIPEPSSLAALAMGALGLFARRRRSV
jgi:hypothetical protein